MSPSISLALAEALTLPWQDLVGEVIGRRLENLGEAFEKTSKLKSLYFLHTYEVATKWESRGTCIVRVETGIPRTNGAKERSCSLSLLET